MTRRILSLFFLLVGVLIVIAILAQTTRQRETISAEKTREMIDTDTNTVVLDVRTEREYNSETGHLARAKLIPVQDLESRLAELTPWKSKTIIAYCRTGSRSGRAASFLREHGFSALNMEGGIVRWNQLEYPVVVEKER
jgi:rhodanese-related sulfurtransferase